MAGQIPDPYSAEGMGLEPGDRIGLFFKAISPQRSLRAQRIEKKNSEPPCSLW